MLLPLKKEESSPPLLMEYVVPLDAGRTLISNGGETIGQWVNPSKYSTVRAVCGVEVSWHWFLERMLTDLPELVTSWSVFCEERDQLAEFGWVDPLLQAPPTLTLNLEGLEVQKVSYLPAGYVLLAERDPKSRGLVTLYPGGLMSFKFHPEHSLRLINVRA